MFLFKLFPLAIHSLLILIQLFCLIQNHYDYGYTQKKASDSMLSLILIIYKQK